MLRSVIRSPLGSAMRGGVAGEPAGPIITVAIELTDDDGTTELVDDDGSTYLTDD